MDGDGDFDELFITQNTFREIESSSDSDNDIENFIEIAEDYEENEISANNCEPVCSPHTSDHVETKVPADKHNPYTPVVEAVSDPDTPNYGIEDEWEIRREMEIYDTATHLGVSTDEVERSLKVAVDVRDMPVLGGPTMVWVQRRQTSSCK